MSKAADPSKSSRVLGGADQFRSPADLLLFGFVRQLRDDLGEKGTLGRRLRNRKVEEPGSLDIGPNEFRIAGIITARRPCINFHGLTRRQRRRFLRSCWRLY